MCLSSSESSSKLLRLLDAVTDALVSAIGKTVLTFRQQYTRLAHLLMLLSHIRHVRYKNTSCHANILILCSIILTQSRFIIPFFFKVTKAWTTSTAWKWRTWCLCMTCCWRCWTPTSCTAPVCLDGAPSRSPRTRVTLLLRLTAPVAAPHTPGLPAALKAQVNRSSQLRIFRLQWITVHKKQFTIDDETFYWNVLQSADSCGLWKRSFDTPCTNSALQSRF